MRTSTLAMVVAIGSVIAPPVLAQQQTVPNPQMQEEADKGVKTRQSGESGYVGEQEKSGASARAPGRPATASRRRARPVERALRRLERARNLAKHELEKRVPSSFSINAKRGLEDLASGLIGSA